MEFSRKRLEADIGGESKGNISGTVAISSHTTVVAKGAPNNDRHGEESTHTSNKQKGRIRTRQPLIKRELHSNSNIGPLSFPSELPSVRPQSKRSIVTNFAPTAEGSLSFPALDHCIDSRLRFTAFNNDVKYTKKCKWVNRGDTAFKCGIQGVSIHCPHTCKKCSTDRCSDSMLKFRYQEDNKNIFTKCKNIKDGDIQNI